MSLCRADHPSREVLPGVRVSECNGVSWIMRMSWHDRDFCAMKPSRTKYLKRQQHKIIWHKLVPDNKDITTDIGTTQYTDISPFGSAKKFHYTLLTTFKVGRVA